MIKLNLLPWRIDARKQVNKWYYICLILSGFLGVCICAVCYFCLEMAIYKTQCVSSALEEEKEKLSAPLAVLRTLTEDKKKLDLHVEVMQTLEKDRVLVLKLMDTLPKVLPAFLHLTKVVRKNTEVILEGRAHTNAGVALLMKNIAAEKRDIQFSNLQLTAITRDRKDAHLRFKISLTLVGDEDNAIVMD